MIAAAVSSPRWLVTSAAQSYSNLGNVYARQGQWTDSVAAYQQALEKNPKILEAWLGLAVALEQVNRWPEAEFAYQNAVRLSPDSARAHFFYSRFRNIAAGPQKPNRASAGPRVGPGGTGVAMNENFSGSNSPVSRC